MFLHSPVNPRLVSLYIGAVNRYGSSPLIGGLGQRFQGRSAASMQRLKVTFQDVGGLHARINTYLSRSSVLRVGIVPQNGRDRAKSVLDALISEPVQNTTWNEVLSRRPLTKDTLVVQSPSFEYTETHNSLVVFPLPFAGPAVEFLEVNSVDGSLEHINTCHMLLDVYNEGKLKEITDPAAEFPRLALLDGTSGANAQLPPRTINIDSKLALEANSLLQESPKNATKFVEMRRRSRIDELRKRMSDTASAYTALRESIFASCRLQINSVAAEMQPKAAEQASSTRTEWTQAAHAELEGTLMPRVRKILQHDLAWFKLYLRSDDVATDVSMVAYGLPESRARFEYLSGLQASRGITSPAETTASVSTDMNTVLDQAISRLQTKSLHSVLAALAVQLPIAGCAAAMHFIGGASTYSMLGLTALGIVTGLRRLQSSWLKASEQFEEAVHDAHIAEIQRLAQQLWEVGESRELSIEARKRELEQALADAMVAETADTAETTENSNAPNSKSSTAKAAGLGM